MTKRSIETHQKRNRIQLLVQTLGRQITDATYGSGDNLPIEPELSEQFNVGRNAVREAVKILVGKGLLRTAPRRGTRVCASDEWNILDPDVMRWIVQSKAKSKRFFEDLCEMRRLIEPGAAELAAKRASKREIAELLATAEDMEHVTSGEEAVATDIRFHEIILKAARNSVLLHFQKAINTLLQINFEFSYLNPDGYWSNLKEHYAIAEAIADRKPKCAREAVIVLLEKNRRDIERVVEQKLETSIRPFMNSKI